MSLKEALKSRDLELLSTLVKTVDKNELKELLIGQNSVHNNSRDTTIDLEGESESFFGEILRTSPEFAYKVLFLFPPADRKEIHSAFTWKDLFTFVKHLNNTTADNKIKSRLTVKQFVEKIRRIFPTIKGDEIEDSSFASLKHYRTALALGMPYNNDFMLRSLKSKVFSSHDLSELLNWLISNKYVTQCPFDLQELAHQLVNGNKRIVDTILKEFPRCIEEIDSVGNNVMFYCATALYRYKFVGPLFQKIRSSIPNASQTLVNLLAHKCQYGYFPAVLIGNKCVTNRPVPAEIIRSYRVILKRNNAEDSTAIVEHIAQYRYQSALANLLHLYLGVGAKYLTPQADILPPMKTDATTGILFFEFPTPEIDKKETQSDRSGQSDLMKKLWEPVRDWSKRIFAGKTNDTVVGADPDPVPYILNLPNELLLSISLYLTPLDAFDYLVCCKRLIAVLKAKQESHWELYSARHFYRSKYTGQHKKRFIVETRGHVNWRANKYHVVTSPELSFGQPQFMDENWLCLLKFNSIWLWNCHSQRIEFAGLSSQLKENLSPQALLNCYNHNEIPPVISYAGSYYQRNYSLIRGENRVELPKLSEIFRNRPISYREFVMTPIDHRVVLTEQSMLYDVTTDHVLNQLHEDQPPQSVVASHAYNPFNRTILRGYHNKLEIYDLDYKLLQSINMNTEAAQMIVVDEHTLLVNWPNTSSFYDLRTGEAMTTAFTVINRWGASTVQSPQRMVFRSNRAPLLSSWNLNTRRIEWVECAESFYPRCVNSRYLAGMNNGVVEIRDYCSNNIYNSL